MMSRRLGVAATVAAAVATLVVALAGPPDAAVVPAATLVALSGPARSAPEAAPLGETASLPARVDAAPYVDPAVGPPPDVVPPAAVPVREARVVLLEEDGTPHRGRDVVFRFVESFRVRQATRSTGLDGRVVWTYPPGDFGSVSVDLADEWFAVDRTFTRSIVVDGGGARSEMGFEIPATGETTLTVRRLPAVVGRVVDADGRPVESAWCELFVRAIGVDGVVAAGTSWSRHEGRFLLPVPRDGRTLPLDATVTEATVKVFSPEDVQPAVVALGGDFTRDVDVGAVAVRLLTWTSFTVLDATGRPAEAPCIGAPDGLGGADASRPTNSSRNPGGPVRWRVRPGEDFVLIGARGCVDRLVPVAGAEEATGRPPTEVQLDAAAVLVVRCRADAEDARCADLLRARVRLVGEAPPVGIGYGGNGRVDGADSASPAYATCWHEPRLANRNQDFGAEFRDVRPGVALHIETGRADWDGARTVVAPLRPGEVRTVDVVVPAMRRVTIQVVGTDGEVRIPASLVGGLAAGRPRDLNFDLDADASLLAFLPFEVVTLLARGLDGRTSAPVVVAPYEDRATLRLGP